VVPWSAFWERNLFVARVPIVREVLLNHFVRGAVSGVGLICLAAALGELAGIFAQRRDRGELGHDGGPGGSGGRPQGVE
jgi:hypothetical protein